MGNSNLLFEKIFKRKVSDAGTRQYLAEIITEHPYFSPAQFYLLTQINKDTDEYKQQAAKTAVVFNNPFWLQFQLQEMNATGVGELKTTNFEDEKLLPPDTDENTVLALEIVHDHLTIAAPSTNEMIEAPQVSEEEKVAVPPSITDEKELEPLSEQGIVLDSLNATHEIATLSTSEISISGPLLLNDESDKTDDIKEQIAVKDNASHTDDLNTLLPVEETLISEPHGHFINEGPPLVNEPETEEDEDGDGIEGKEMQPLNFKLNIDTSATTENTITFEPLHTSDYFASLGIKLSSAIPDNDKLGKHLKSFTEWLKTMKKVHSEQLPVQSAQAETSIQKLAEQSNKDDDVVTEAMAEVLLQQGKADKAIEVYKKLSLLNPSKSTFFAAKIDQLKEH